MDQHEGRKPIAVVVTLAKDYDLSIIHPLSLSAAGHHPGQWPARSLRGGTSPAHPGVVEAYVGDVSHDPAVAKGAGHRDAVAPVKHVILAAASVQVHRVHSAAGPDAGGNPLKARSRRLGGGPEMTVEVPGGLDRADDLPDRHHRLSVHPEAACARKLPTVHAWPGRAGDGRHLTQHRQAVAAGWTAVQPPGQLGPARVPPGAVEIIPGVLVR